MPQIPQEVHGLVRAALGAIVASNAAFLLYDDEPETRMAAEHALLERAREMRKGPTLARPALLVLTAEVRALGSPLASWRMIALAHGLHELNEWARGVNVIGGASPSLERAKQLIELAASDRLQLTFPGADECTQAAHEAITSELTAQDWRGEWAVTSLVFPDAGKNALPYVDLVSRVLDLRAFPKLSDDLVRIKNTELGIGEPFTVVVTKATAAAWIDEKRRKIRAQAEEQLLIAAAKVADARKLDALYAQYAPAT